MGTGVPSRGGTVTLHWDTMQKGRTDGNSFSDNDSEETGLGQLGKSEEVAWVNKTNN